MKSPQFEGNAQPRRNLLVGEGIHAKFQKSFPCGKSESRFSVLCEEGELSCVRYEILPCGPLPLKLCSQCFQSFSLFHLKKSPFFFGYSLISLIFGNIKARTADGFGRIAVVLLFCYEEDSIFIAKAMRNLS